MYHYFIHSSADGHLGCFHVLAIVNSAVINIVVYVFFFFFELWFSHGLFGASHKALAVNNLPANAGDARDASSILGSGRSPGEGVGNPFQYSCLENPMDRRAWQATVYRVTKSQIRLKRLSTHTHSTCPVVRLLRHMVVLSLVF